MTLYPMKSQWCNCSVALSDGCVPHASETRQGRAYGTLSSKDGKRQNQWGHTCLSMQMPFGLWGCGKRSFFFFTVKLKLERYLATKIQKMKRKYIHGPLLHPRLLNRSSYNTEINIWGTKTCCHVECLYLHTGLTKFLLAYLFM